jgi:hypothetical protein
MNTTANVALDRRIDAAACRLRSSRDATRRHALALRTQLRSPLVWLCASVAAVGLGCAAACTLSRAARAAGPVRTLAGIVSMVSLFAARTAPTATAPPSQPLPRQDPMLTTVALVLLVLWLLGLVTSTTLGGFIHILLVIAVVVILLRVINGRKPL